MLEGENILVKKVKFLPILLILAVLVAVLGASYFGWEKYKSNEAEKLALTERITQLENNLAQSETEKENLARELEEQKNIVDYFSDQVEDFTKIVGTLEKLSKTDEELLQKYSKVYFLNEHYVPSDLVILDKKWGVRSDAPLQVHSDVERFLEDLLNEAEDDGINLRILSAYRSFNTQEGLKSGYSVTYGQGANTFSADQGYSEHQLGTTVDLTTKERGAIFGDFESTEAYSWLLKNAYKYGFTLSYPKGNGYYVFEPWHWRFVGKDLARYLHQKDVHFYDLGQREIDEYLVSIFDK